MKNQIKKLVYFCVYYAYIIYCRVKDLWNPNRKSVPSDLNFSLVAANAQQQCESYIGFVNFSIYLVEKQFFFYFLQQYHDFKSSSARLLLKGSRSLKLELQNLISPIPDEMHSNSWYDLLVRNNFDDESLGKYYNSKCVTGFTFARLNNANWLNSRLLPLLLVHDSTMSSSTYVEDGGADGLMPIFSSYICKNTISVELNDSQRLFSEKLAAIAGITNFNTITSFDTIDASSVDILSSHQVLEHMNEPLIHATMYFNKLKSGGILITSVGFNVHPHPGHLPNTTRFAGREKDFFESAGFLPHKFNDICYATFGTLIYIKP